MSLGALLWGRETALATALKSEREREREHRKSGLKHGSVVDPARFSSGLQRTGEAVEQEMGPALHCRRPPLPQRRGATTATPSIVIPRSRPVGSSDTFRISCGISFWVFFGRGKKTMVLCFSCSVRRVKLQERRPVEIGR
ncbi:hypothetical protein MUK42_03660 [Musa troglodytarum]|uniref:Uncharacterized protein n=1 Tax=Musa troglodytarum TaxID=320322 RepID=A0A9E7GUA7_9LILI|nr:hypothetical protein MUK42_03660 [Musa troglodytarum]